MPACVQEDFLPSTDLPRPRRRVAARARRLQAECCRDYIPAAGWFGSDEFTYTIQDPDGLTDTASVFVTVDNIDDSVFAYDDWAYAPMNGAGHLIDVLANDEEADGDTLTISLPSTGQPGYPAHGAIVKVTGSPEQVRYTPAAEYFGYDEFTYTVDDGHDGDTATVSVIVYMLTVNVSPGYCVPGTTRWAVPVGDQYYGTVVTLMVDTLPAGVPLYDMTVAWTGADVDPAYSVYAYHDRTVTGAYNVAVQVTDADDESIDTDAELVVVGIDRIVSDDANLLEAETGNSDNAVTGVSSDPASVTVKALVTPSTPDVSAVYNRLIVWGGTRGSVGITPDRYGLPRDYPAKIPVRARIGASSDELDVWAVRVNVRVGGLSEEQEELDACAVSVHVNSDDNNRSGVPDVNESNDVLGLGVTGEDDLVPVGIGLEPRGVPVGELALVLPAGDHFAACANDNKAGGRLNPSSWSLDAGQPPYGIALEGVSLTNSQSLLLQYSLGTTLLSEDSAKVKCVAHPDTTGGAAGAFFKMYATRPIGGGGGGMGVQSTDAGGQMHSQGFEMITDGDPVGGDVTVAFVVSLPKRSYVMADAASLLYTDDAYPDEVNSINLGVYFTQGCWLKYGPGTPDEWDFFIDDNGKTSIGSPIHEPTYTLRDDPIIVATTQSINTRIFPWNGSFPGTNGPHSVRLHKLWFDDPYLEFDAVPFPINENGYLTVAARASRPSLLT